MNNLKLFIYSSGTTPIYDSGNELDFGDDLWFAKGYATGSLAAGMFVGRDPSRWWEIKGMLRAEILNGQTVVYEGFIPELEDRFTQTVFGQMINFIGPWGHWLMNRTMRKRWADDRVDDQTWEYMTSAGTRVQELCNIQRDGRLYFVPKPEAWGAGDYAALRDEFPTGNIERITFDYAFTEEAGQNWTASLYDVDNASTEWTLSATGSGSVDLDSTNDYTATTKFEFRLTSNAGQTPTSSGATSLKITNLMVYGEDETGSGISINTVAADIITEHSDVFNSDTNYLAATNLRTVEPFITTGDGYDTVANILTNLAEFGDTNDARVAVGCKLSSTAATPDGKPVIFTADWPTTTDHDYFLPREQAEALNITRDYGNIVNYVLVGYTDSEGNTQWVGPDNDASLTDATSVSEYGERHYPGGLYIGNSTQAKAIEYGARYLAEWKDPKWVVNGTIDIVGSIAGAAGNQVAASMIAPGKILKIDGYDNFVVSMLEYRDQTRTASLTTGKPGQLIFTQSVFAQVWNDAIAGNDVTTATGTGAGGPSLRKRLDVSKAWKKANPEAYRKMRIDIQRYMRKHNVNANAAKRALGY